MGIGAVGSSSFPVAHRIWLRNVLRYALAIADGDRIWSDHLPAELNETDSRAALLPPITALPGLFEYEGQRLLASLRRNKWNVTAVSAELDICRATVYRQMKKFGIVPPNQQCQ